MQRELKAGRKKLRNNIFNQCDDVKTVTLRLTRVNLVLDSPAEVGKVTSVWKIFVKSDFRYFWGKAKLGDDKNFKLLCRSNYSLTGLIVTINWSCFAFPLKFSIHIKFESKLRLCFHWKIFNQKSDKNDENFHCEKQKPL